MPSEVEDGRNETPEQSSGAAVPPPHSPAASHELHCPRCGGPVHRPWSGVFVLNLVTFLILGALTLPVIPFFISLASVVGGVLVLIWLAAVLISFFGLPITGAVAVAARPRCDVCGHRFWPAAIAGGMAPARFPLRFALAGGALLLVPLAIGMAWVAGVPGRETWTVTMVIGGRIIMAVLALGAGFLGQAILWRVLRTRMATGWRQGLALLLPAIVLGTGWLALTAHDRSTLSRRYNPVARVSRILAWAQLAELPGSASGVAVDFWAFMLSGKCYLRFAAEPNDIERFLADSPALKGLVCQNYSRERMRIRSAGSQAGFIGPQDGHEHFYSTGRPPPWYEEEIRGAGRRYEINVEAGKWLGELIVDDERHVVYMRLDRY